MSVTAVSVAPPLSAAARRLIVLEQRVRDCRDGRLDLSDAGIDDKCARALICGGLSCLPCLLQNISNLELTVVLWRMRLRKLCVL